MNPLGDVVDENVLVVETFSQKQLRSDARTEIVSLIISYLDQDAAAIVIGPTMYLYERSQ